MRLAPWLHFCGALAALVSCTWAGTAYGQVVFATPGQTPADAQQAAPSAMTPTPLPLNPPARPYSAEINPAPHMAAMDHNVGAPSYTNLIRNTDQAPPVSVKDAVATVGGARENGSSNECNNASCGCNGASCGHCDDCCTPFWEHRSMVFGDLLFMQARDVDLPYAIPTDGVVAATSVPVGPVAVADPDYEAWFRAGFGLALSPCSSLGLGYTHFESHTNDAVAINAPNVIFPLVVDPATVNALAFGQTAAASYDIDFQLLDLDLRRLASGGSRHAVNYSVGARYGHMDQDFRAVFAAQPGFTAVDTRIGFDGGGPRFGIDGERLLGNTRLTMYGKAAASFLAGQYRATFVQTNAFTGVQASTAWNDDRIVPIIEYEVGLGWISPSGRVRLATGYTMAGWFNSLTTGTLIEAEQMFDFVNVHDTITFDGFVARLELRR